MSLENKTENRLDIEKKNDDDDSNIWRSCCLIVSPHAIAYFSQIFITLIVLAISSYFLILSEGDCNKSSPWINIITFLIGKVLGNVITSA